MGQPLNQLVGNSQLIWWWTNSSEKKDWQLILWAGSSRYSSGTGPAHHRVENGQLIWKIVKETISEKLNVMDFFVVVVFLAFLYLEIKLNIISLNHKLVRCPSLERDWSSGDHVPIPGWVLRYSFTQLHCSSVGFSHPAANITAISYWDGLHLQFFLCAGVFSDNWHSSARRCSAEYPVTVLLHLLLCGVVGWLLLCT